MLIGHWALPNARYISVNPVAFAADTLKATWLLIIDHYWSIGGVLLQSNMIFLFWDQEYPMLTESGVKKRSTNQPLSLLLPPSSYMI